MPRSRPLASELIERALLVPGTRLAPTRFGAPSEPAIWAHGREILHVHHAQEIDLRLTRRAIAARRAELRANPRVSLRGSSDWMTIGFTARAHLAGVLELVAAAVSANRR